MRRLVVQGVTFLASAVVALTTCVEARAGHWVWQYQGINSGWVYVQDDSDNSAYTWHGESSGPAQQPSKGQQNNQSLHAASQAQANSYQPLGRTAPPIVTQQAIQTEQAARIRYNQALLQQGKTNFKPTLLSSYRHP